MQRHGALCILFGAGDLGAAKTAGHHDANTERAETHRVLDRALHGAAERPPALKLASDVLGDERGVDFRLADLDQVHANLVFGHLRQLFPKHFDVSALLADHKTRTGRVDRHDALLVRTLDDNP